MKRPQAFSLVELSIVLVILGLLVGGVLSGKSLIRAAELRKVKTSVDRYIAAGLQFRDKYQCIPGDCANFSSFFPSASNGDGDNMVASSPTLLALEYMFVWNHLSRAGLIEGYSGQYSCCSATNPIVGTDVPASGLGSNGFFFLGYIAPVNNIYGYIPLGNYGHTISLYSLRGSFQMDYVGANLSQQEIYGLDMKYDDGKPQTGIIRTGLGQQYAAGAAAYDLTDTSLGCCNPMFITGF